MKLPENRDEFEEMIIMTARQYEISSSLVEKDYYSTLFLKELSKQNIPVVFICRKYKTFPH